MDRVLPHIMTTVNVTSSESSVSEWRGSAPLNAVADFMETFTKRKGDSSRNTMVGSDLSQLRKLRHLPKCALLLEEILDNMIIDLRASPNTDWVSLFKVHSQSGFDVRRGAVVDYGNVEYPVLLHCLASLSPPVAERLAVLQSRWPSLGLSLRSIMAEPSPEQTGLTCEDCHRMGVSKRSLILQSDIIEIVLGSLRGEAYYNRTPRLSVYQCETLPSVFDQWCQAMRCIHLLDSRLRSGVLKYKSERVDPWITHFENTQQLTELWGKTKAGLNGGHDGPGTVDCRPAIWALQKEKEMKMGKKEKQKRWDQNKEEREKKNNPKGRGKR